MSRENVDTLREVTDAFNRRDRAAALPHCDPELENIPPRNWPESEPVKGAVAVWDFLLEGQVSWGGGAYEVVEAIEVGDDKVVAHMRSQLVGKGSGAPVPWAYWLVATFRSDKLLRYEWFADQSEAFEAAGVSA
jgi:ketosteroid isomerase-like protein